MKEFLRDALLAIGGVALVIGARVALFMPGEMMAVLRSAPIEAANSGRAAQSADTPRLQHTTKGS